MIAILDVNKYRCQSIKHIQHKHTLHLLIIHYSIFSVSDSVSYDSTYSQKLINVVANKFFLVFGLWGKCFGFRHQTLTGNMLTERKNQNPFIADSCVLLLLAAISCRNESIYQNLINSVSLYSTLYFQFSYRNQGYT